jgi:hypothetical protein
MSRRCVRRLAGLRKPWRGAPPALRLAFSIVFAPMKEYQAVMLRLTHHLNEDEDALTDLLNERSRSGWQPALIAQSAAGNGSLVGGDRLTVVFQRVTEPPLGG